MKGQNEDHDLSPEENTRILNMNIFSGRWKQRLWQGSIAVCALTIINMMMLEILFAHFLEMSFVMAENQNRRPMFASKSGQFINYQRRMSQEDLVSISHGAEVFGLDFISKISDEYKALPYLSYMVSPFAIWSLLLMLTEGANGNTLHELRQTLAIGNDQNVVRSAYRQITHYLTYSLNMIK